MSLTDILTYFAGFVFVVAIIGKGFTSSDKK